MKHLLVDTNIFVYITLLTSEGEDRKVFKSFKKALSDNKLKLLLPEVVVLEYSRTTTEEYQSIGENIGKLKRYIKEEMQKDKVILEDRIIDKISLGDRIIKEIDESLDKILGKRKRRYKRVKKKVLELFEHRNTIKIPLTNRLLLETLKYSLQGKKPLDPNIKTYFQPDVLFVLAASSYIQKNKIKNLIICSNDLAAFSKAEKVDSITYEPNEDITALFPTLNKCYRFLTDLLNEELKSAIDKEKLTVPESHLAKIMEQRAIDYYSGVMRALKENREAAERALLPIQQHVKLQQEHIQRVADHFGWPYETKGPEKNNKNGEGS